MAIPIGGLATGLDTDTLIKQMLMIERKPVTSLETRKLKLQAVATVYQDLNSRMATLKTRADALRDPATFFGRSVTSSDETVATATATNGVVQGTFTVTTTQLARGAIAAAGVTKGALTDTVANGNGSLRFKLGASGAEVTVEVTSATTLEDLVDDINSANAGVRATVVNMGTSAAPAYKLTMTSNATGAANDIVITGDDTTLTVASTQTALDATFSVTGLGAFTRSSNTVSDVIDGVTMTLKAGAGSTALSITYDKNATQAKVQNLLDAYNDVIKTIDGQTLAKTDAAGTVTAGAFTGDAVPRVMRQGLATVIGAAFSGTFTRLADVGITTQRDGTLLMNTTSFQNALASDTVSLSTLVAGSSSADGVADLLWTKADAATKTLTGTIAVRQDGITATIKSIQRQIDAGLVRLETSERALRARFANLEMLMSRIQSTGSSLLAQLSSLENINRPLS